MATSFFYSRFYSWPFFADRGSFGQAVRVKPFENVTLGLSVETFEMYPEVDCRRGCGKLGNAKRFPRRLRRRVFPSRFAGLVVLFSLPAPWGPPPLRTLAADAPAANYVRPSG